jgi:ubiquinone/menaquinone biosynthesis C-methylase UbiE
MGIENDALFEERFDPNFDKGLVLDITWFGALRKYDLALKYIGEGDKVLDFGCGCGWGTEEISKKTKNVVGIDIDEEAVEIGRQRYPNIDLRVQDLFDLNSGTDYFDVVTGVESIEHVDDPRKVLEEFHKVLRKNGTLILTTPNGTNTMQDGKPANPYHIKEYSVDEMHQMLRETGFVTERTLGQYIPFGFLMRLLNKRISHSHHPNTGRMQKTLDSLPLVARLSSHYVPYGLFASKSVAYVAKCEK